MDETPAPLDEYRLLELVRAGLPDGNKVTKVRSLTIATGYSNRTYLLEGLNQILRLPPLPPGLLPPYDLALQCDTMKYAKAILPDLVPAVEGPYTLCHSPLLVGYLMEPIEGVAFEINYPEDWFIACSEAEKSVMCEDIIRAMTAFHKASIDTCPCPKRTLQEEVNWWKVRLNETQGNRLTIEVLEKLADTAPPVSAPGYVHGDFKVGNFMWSNKRLGAIFDYELSHIGDPLEDLAYFIIVNATIPPSPDVPFVENKGWWSAEKFVEAWEENMGIKVCNFEWHKIFQIAKIAAVVGIGAQLLEQGTLNDPRMDIWPRVRDVHAEWAADEFGKIP